MKKLASIFQIFGRVIRHWLLLFICLNSLILFSQNYPTRHFTMRDGLPSMSVRCIYKDPRGLMWIGTDAGLCTFDGKSFRIFKPSEGMTANQIWAIAEDQRGNLWFGSYGEGLYKYDGKHFERFTMKDGLVDDRIRVLCWSKNFNCLVVGCQSGVSTVMGQTITRSPEETFSKKNGSCVTGLADAGKSIYITTYGSNNPLRFYPDKNLFISLNDKGTKYPDYSFSVFISSKGDTVFSDKNSGVRIFMMDGIVQDDSMGQIFGISEDKRGDIWMASWSYLNREMKEGVFRYSGKSFRNYKDEFGITDKEIWSVFCDREQDILWIGTLTEGLFNVPFSSITNYPASYFGLEQLKINDVFLDSKQALWISDKRELIRMEPSGSFSFIDKHPMMSSVRHFWNDRNAANYWPLEPDMKAALSLNQFQLADFEKKIAFDYQKVIEAEDHSIYFTNKFGLFSFPFENKKAEYYGPLANFGDFSVVGKDTLWMSKWGPTELIPDYRNSRSLLPESQFLAFKDGNPKDVNRMVNHGKQFWYATLSGGLWMSEGSNRNHFNESDSTISKNLNDICFDQKGHAIFGSNSGEICIATYSDKKLNIEYRINNENGLQGSSISWLVADQSGKLWAGTNLGLNCIDLEVLYASGKPLIRFLDEENGYMGQSSKRAVIDLQGNLWIGGDDQLIRLDTKSFLSPSTNPLKISLKSLEINHTPLDSIVKKDLNPWTSLPVRSFTLKHSENNLIFYYDILNYTNPEKDRFRFRLRGFDPDWHQWDAGRKAVYTNLPPGKYTFCVESYNIGTLEQAVPLNIELTIRHPWWKLWYLQLLAIALMLALAVFFTRKYTQAEKEKQLKKSEIEKKIAQLEMQALQAQMNPHFIFNCMNSIQYYVLARKMDEALVYLSDFSKVLRELLVNATQHMVPLKQEIEFLNSYLRLEQMRFPEKFDYEVRSIEGENVDAILMPPMLVQPFAENAIRHGFMNLEKKGHLLIVFEKKRNNILKCTISDNGIGREKAHKQKASIYEKDRPHSASITETRVRLFNSSDSPPNFKIIYTDLTENDKQSGLKVELYLPMEMIGDSN